jgi:hypothetical protein
MVSRHFTEEKGDDATVEGWFAGRSRTEKQAIFEILRRDYDVVSQWLEDPQNAESGFFTFLQRKGSS